MGMDNRQQSGKVRVADHHPGIIRFELIFIVAVPDAQAVSG
jgi:hypothetical protein